MTEQEAIDAYKAKFGSYPAFLLMGMEKSKLIETIQEALDTGQAIKFDPELVY